VITRRDVLKTIPVLAGSALATSCGYTLAGRGSFLPDYIRTIAIPLFQNRTPYLTAELLFTERVRVEFQSRGRYSVQPAEPGADAIVRGDIVGFNASPVGFNDGQLASRYRFTVAVGVKFDDVKQQKTLWENPALSYSDEYDLTSRTSLGLDATAFLEQERVAIDRLANDFARSVVSAILEAF